MSNISNTLKQDDAIFKALDLKTINRLICTTDRGVLALQIRKGENNYHLTLDAVPLDKEKNKELMDLLFPMPQMEKPKEVQKKPLTWNGVPITPDSKEANALNALNPLSRKTYTPKIEDTSKIIPGKKKLGRPKGSKDGRKDME